MNTTSTHRPAAPTSSPVLADLVASLADELVAVRRDLHTHPEIGRAEVRTTEVVADRLRREGLDPVLLPGTGLTCDVGADPRDSAAPRDPADPRDPAGTGDRVVTHVHTVALRADLDALPLPDETGTEWASAVPGTAHACGHDLHTAAVLGAGLVLARMHEHQPLPFRVRLVFQPAEEATPGGALDVLESGAMAGVDRILALHCDPHLDTGHVGLRVGAITSAADHVRIVLRGDGGHTSRPHLTGDLVFALGHLATALPAALSRRLDPRAGVSLVWGRITAGAAANAIPRVGELEGTLRVLDADVWGRAGELLAGLVDQLVTPFGVTAELQHTRGVPPTVNESSSVAVLEAAARSELGHHAAVPTEQSLGGEDFAWYLDSVPGALARLGTRRPGGPTYDLHRGDFEPDEAAITVGVRLLVAACAASSGFAVDA